MPRCASPGSRTPGPASRGLALALALALLAGAPGCGNGGTPREPEPGTVVLVNESDQGMTPLTVESFFLQPDGEADPGADRLGQDLLPGGVAIIGLFPPGLYDALAVLSNGLSIPFSNRPVRAGEPSNFVIPAN